VNICDVNLRQQSAAADAAETTGTNAVSNGRWAHWWCQVSTVHGSVDAV